MPIYEYNCKSCNKNFSLLQPIGVDESTTKCPECDSSDTKRLMSMFSCSTSSSEVGKMDSMPAMPMGGPIGGG
ncbi:MAG: zinc ribbon domain-containing protein [Candidatus Magnetoovum sp. WYHC-5]|nr:zinc ribbon domain-containing protein [Candidatus Magnetoovum sp. WYHC-5]